MIKEIMKNNEILARHITSDEIKEGLSFFQMIMSIFKLVLGIIIREKNY
ncbi:hypothetical protein V6948_10470 [Fusobacterium varium]